MGKTLLHTLIQSKTRLKLLLRFFLNPESSAYLRGLAEEFNESTNSVRIELNRFEKAGFIKSHRDGNKKIYTVNTDYPLYADIQQIAFKHFGIDKVIEQVVKKLGDVDQVYVIGDLAMGLDSGEINVAILGDKIDEAYLNRLIEKSEDIIDRSLKAEILSLHELQVLEDPKLLIYGD